LYLVHVHNDTAVAGRSVKITHDFKTSKADCVGATLFDGKVLETAPLSATHKNDKRIFDLSF
jgi:hypothetical protein